MQPVFSGSPWKMCAHQKGQTSDTEKTAPREQAVHRKDGRIPGLTVKERPRTTAEKQEASRTTSPDGSKEGGAPGGSPPGTPGARRLPGGLLVLFN